MRGHSRDLGASFVPTMTVSHDRDMLCWDDDNSYESPRPVMPRHPDLDTAIHWDRDVARLGAVLARRGDPAGPVIRRLALRSIRRKRQAYWRGEVEERIDLGYRDLGGEA